MSFNSKAFLADRERLLEEPVKGTRSSRWHQDQHTVHTVLVLPPPEYISEQEQIEQEDEYLKQFGI